MITNARLTAIGKHLPRLAREMQQRVAREYAAFIKEELQRQHHTGRSIYDDRYPKPKKGNQPLLDTGELEAGYFVSVTPGARSVHIEQLSEHTIVSSDGKHTHMPDERGTPLRWKIRLQQIKKNAERWFVAELKRL